MIRSRIKARLKAFKEETGGTVSMEFVIMAPLIFWAFASMFTWFDAYRQVTIHEKAAFTISDMISREVEPINGAYLNGTHDLLRFLTRASNDPSLRVSIIRYVKKKDEFRLDWSRKRGDYELLTNAQVANWHDKLPKMVGGERIILVETKMTYQPPFKYGLLSEYDLETFVFARPRFVPKLCWSACKKPKNS